MVRVVLFKLCFMKCKNCFVYIHTYFQSIFLYKDHFESFTCYLIFKTKHLLVKNKCIQVTLNGTLDFKCIRVHPFYTALKY